MSRNKRNQPAVKALEAESYESWREAETRWQKLGGAWWSSPPVLIFLTVALAALDAVVLYSLLDTAMTQAAWMGIAVAFGIALVLNFLPLVVAACLQNALYGLERGALVKAIAGILAFLALFSATVGLRFAYKDMYGADSQTTALVNTAGDTSQGAPAEEEGEDSKSLSTVILLSVEPLVTSVLGFLLAFFSSNPLLSKINHLRMRRWELLEARSDLLAALSGMDCDRDQMLEQDEQLFQAAQELVRTRCGQLRAEARFMLSEHLKDPSAISRLSQGDMLEAMPAADTLQPPEASAERRVLDLPA